MYHISPQHCQLAEPIGCLSSRIKGDEFSIHKLLDVDPKSKQAAEFNVSSFAIFRLAPADYHRFHSPLDAVVGEVRHIPGQYYTGTFIS
jgi:phosphatidylserine decarboxylase